MTRDYTDALLQFSNGFFNNAMTNQSMMWKRTKRMKAQKHRWCLIKVVAYQLGYKKALNCIHIDKLLLYLIPHCHKQTIVPPERIRPRAAREKNILPI